MRLRPAIAVRPTTQAARQQLRSPQRVPTKCYSTSLQALVRTELIVTALRLSTQQLDKQQQQLDKGPPQTQPVVPDLQPYSRRNCSRLCSGRCVGLAEAGLDVLLGYCSDDALSAHGVLPLVLRQRQYLRARRTGPCVCREGCGTGRVYRGAGQKRP